MPVIRIINPTPGPTTTERILELLNSRNQGVTIKELCHILNRPVSMVQRCLKLLTASGQVYSRLDDTGRQLVYYGRKPILLG
ncbi:MAG: winged helix-turn-helix transcriptional regulator [Symploca sp. SIO2E6]|nr:winged helix-turn-helix transcriptional regulator [Symploca sp. SIO2E6]